MRGKSITDVHPYALCASLRVSTASIDEFIESSSLSPVCLSTLAPIVTVPQIVQLVFVWYSLVERIMI